METNAPIPLPHAELVLNRQLRQWNALWVRLAAGVRQESTRLRQHSHELQARYQELRQCYFLVECAWCQKRLGWKPKMAAVPGDTSYSICPPCAADILRETAQRHFPLPWYVVDYKAEIARQWPLPSQSPAVTPATGPGNREST